MITAGVVLILLSSVGVCGGVRIGDTAERGSCLMTARSSGGKSKEGERKGKNAQLDSENIADCTTETSQVSTLDRSLPGDLAFNSSMLISLQDDEVDADELRDISARF